MREIQCENRKSTAPNFGSPKIAVKPESITYMSNLDIFRDSQFGAMHLILAL